jgi:hypothetical protein
MPADRSGGRRLTSRQEKVAAGAVGDDRAHRTGDAELIADIALELRIADAADLRVHQVSLSDRWTVPVLFPVFMPPPSAAMAQGPRCTPGHGRAPTVSGAVHGHPETRWRSPHCRDRPVPRPNPVLAGMGDDWPRRPGGRQGSATRLRSANRFLFPSRPSRGTSTHVRSGTLSGKRPKQSRGVKSNENPWWCRRLPHRCDCSTGTPWTTYPPSLAASTLWIN